MKLARASTAAVGLFALAVIAAPEPARALDPPPGGARITVLARGHASLPADSIEVEFTVSASSDDSAEAERRYQERLAKVIAAAKGSPEATTSKSEKKKAAAAAADEKPAK